MVMSVLGNVVSVEWVEFTEVAGRSVNACWFVLMAVKSVATSLVRHVPWIVKVIACTANVIKHVENRACLVVTRVHGNANITSAISSATRFATGRDVTYPATKSCHVTTLAVV